MEPIRRIWARIPEHVSKHLAIFVIANVAFAIAAIVTNSGFWWMPMTLGVWGVAVAIDVGFGAWMARRSEWTDDEQRSTLLTPPNPLDDRS